MISILPIVFALSLAIYIVATVVIELRRRKNYWRKRGIPGPEPALFTGNLQAIWGPDYPPVLRYRDWTRHYGRFYGVQLGGVSMLVISDPEMAQNLLSRDFSVFHERKLPPNEGDPDTKEFASVFSARGIRWKRLRAISNSVFSVNNLKRILPLVNDSACVMVKFFTEKASSNMPITVNQHWDEYTMDVIGRVAMGQRGTRQFRNPYTRFCADVLLSEGNNWEEWVGWLFPAIGTFLHHAGLQFKTLHDDLFPRFLDVILKAVEKRRKKRLSKDEPANVDESNQSDDDVDSRLSEYEDFIDFFLDSESESIKNKRMDNALFKTSESKISKQMTKGEVVTNCATLVLAGFDTTATTLTYTCYFLAINPEVQCQLRKEIVEICPMDEEPTYEQLNRLELTEAVMRETLRLQPIAGNVVGRYSTKDTTLRGSNGNEIPIDEGTIVQLDLISMQTDPEIWGQDAEQFRPERWLKMNGIDETSRKAMLASWLPFGGGPRICVGMRMAQIVFKSAIVHLIRTFELQCCPETEEKLKHYGTTIMHAKSVTIEFTPIR